MGVVEGKTILGNQFESVRAILKVAEGRIREMEEEEARIMRSVTEEKKNLQARLRQAEQKIRKMEEEKEEEARIMMSVTEEKKNLQARLSQLRPNCTELKRKSEKYKRNLKKKMPLYK